MTLCLRLAIAANSRAERMRDQQEIDLAHGVYVWQGDSARHVSACPQPRPRTPLGTRSGARDACVDRTNDLVDRST